MNANSNSTRGALTSEPTARQRTANLESARLNSITVITLDALDAKRICVFLIVMRTSTSANRCYRAINTHNWGRITNAIIGTQLQEVTISPVFSLVFYECVAVASTPLKRLAILSLHWLPDPSSSLPPSPPWAKCNTPTQKTKLHHHPNNQHQNNQSYQNSWNAPSVLSPSLITINYFITRPASTLKKIILKNNNQNKNPRCQR